MVKVTLSSPLKKISRNSIGQLPRRPSFFVICCCCCCCCSFLGWVYVLIAVWCLVQSVLTCYLSGLQRISKQEKVWIEMEVIFFRVFFFQQYKLHGVLWLSPYYNSLIFIYFIQFSVMKKCYKDVYKKRALFTLCTNRQLPSSFSSLSCRIIRQITDVLNLF